MLSLGCQDRTQHKYEELSLNENEFFCCCVWAQRGGGNLCCPDSLTNLTPFPLMQVSPSPCNICRGRRRGPDQVPRRYWKGEDGTVKCDQKAQVECQCIFFGGCLAGFIFVVAVSNFLLFLAIGSLWAVFFVPRETVFVFVYHLWCTKILQMGMTQ